MSVLEVANLSKRFDSLEVIRGVSFSLDKGESLAIIGSSGSGKTTLLRCLNGLEMPNAGTISINGERLFDAADARSVNMKRRWDSRHFGLVFQSFNLFPQYTALENVTLAVELNARRSPEYRGNRREAISSIRRDGLAILDSVGLSAKADAYPHQLSGGQQQRVAIARALARDPDILCFDEPTSALDPELTGEVLNVIRGLASRNTTMVIVTHEMRFARQVADNALFIDNGVVIEYGAAEEVISHPREERTRQFLERYSNG
ncbi:MAG: amino acid ABC transporter ATP-binding protein [Oscillospiraceae bacterium]|nr:amino acid ABC transporter ATP-binding protein [Oscillospiraceae bacterium]